MTANAPCFTYTWLWGLLWLFSDLFDAFPLFLTKNTSVKNKQTSQHTKTPSGHIMNNSHGEKWNMEQMDVVHSIKLSYLHQRGRFLASRPTFSQKLCHWSSHWLLWRNEKKKCTFICWYRFRWELCDRKYIYLKPFWPYMKNKVAWMIINICSSRSLCLSQ